MISLIGVLGFLLTVLEPGRGVYAELVDRIVAEVNDEIILLSELEGAIAPFAEKIRNSAYPAKQKREALFKLRKDILDRLIDQKLTDQQVKANKISVAKEEIDAAIEQIKEARYLTDEQLREALAQEGLTLESYRERIEEQIMRTRLVNIEVRSKIIITDEDVREYYETHPVEYGREQQYHLRNIILMVPEDAEEMLRELKRNKAKAVLEKLEAGEEFEALARQYSESLAAEGGDLGTFALSDLAQSVQEAVKPLSAGEHTGIIESDLGFQIFFVEKIIESQGTPFAEVKEEIQEKLFQEIVNENFDEWLKNLRSRSHIRIIQ